MRVEQLKYLMLRRRHGEAHVIAEKALDANPDCSYLYYWCVPFSPMDLG